MPPTFAGKHIVLGVCGSIAAFKVAGWVSALAKEEALVDVVMTESGLRFVTPLTFAALSGRQVFTDMFRAEEEGSISHISLGREADCIVVAPATAQTMARLACGLADDLLSTTILAADVPVVICPAMNVKMYAHPATQKNISILKGYGYRVLDPDQGPMACGEEGPGRLPPWEAVAEHLLLELGERDLAGQTVLVTAGPTREPYDPARFLSNRSSGKMGYAIARTAFRRGARVTLISGPTDLDCPVGVRCLPVESALEMYDAVMEECEHASVIIKAAAVSDFRCTEYHQEKVKKDGAPLVLDLTKNPDILQELGRRCIPDRQLLIGFAAESSNLIDEARKKLRRKRCRLIAVNNIAAEHTGFSADGNQLTLVEENGVTELPYTTKLKTADLLWDHLRDRAMLPAV